MGHRSDLRSRSGLEYYPHLDQLVATFADGSFQAFIDISTRPTATPSSSTPDPSGEEDKEHGLLSTTTESLSRTAREILVAIEEGTKRVTWKDVMGINAAKAYGELGSFIWLHQ